MSSNLKANCYEFTTGCRKSCFSLGPTSLKRLGYTDLVVWAQGQLKRLI